MVERARGASTLAAAIWPEQYGRLVRAVVLVLLGVITSYSIHYTKLYDGALHNFDAVDGEHRNDVEFDFPRIARENGCAVDQEQHATSERAAVSARSADVHLVLRDVYAARNNFV